MPASARTKLAKEGNMGAKGVLGEKEEKEDLVGKGDKGESEASGGQKEARSIGTNLLILVFLALAYKLVGV